MSTHDNTYNGWANYETWNVALYINNDYGQYTMANECDDYGEFVVLVHEFRPDAIGYETPDGVSWTDSSLDIDELNADVFGGEE